MTTLADIEAAPAGPQIGAFFDFDGTVIEGFSAAAFLQDRAARDDLPLEELLGLIWGMIETDRGRADFTAFMRKGCRSFRGQDEATLAELGVRLFETRLRQALFPDATARISAHQARGHTVVLASSALPFQISAAAAELGIDHIVCTRLELRDGICTGRLGGPVIWGEGKADAVRAFADTHAIELQESFAYANGDEDIPFLECVGHATAINPKKALDAAAARNGWAVEQFRAAERRSLAARSIGLVRGAAGTSARALGITDGPQ